MQEVGEVAPSSLKTITAKLSSAFLEEPLQSRSLCLEDSMGGMILKTNPMPTG